MSQAIKTQLIEPNSAQPQAFQLGPYYASLVDAKTALAVTGGQSFWQDLMAGHLPPVEKGWLVSMFTYSEAWGFWENHVNGEEVVILLSGVVDFVLESQGQTSVVRLAGQGSFVIVPRNTWHTARVIETATMLFLTSGEGTQHRPVAKEADVPG